MTRQAVVLAGGLGTRMGRLTATTPKPLLSVGGRPFVEWLLSELRRKGIQEVLLLAGFLGNQFEPIASAWPEVKIIIEPSPLGTGGAIRHALTRLDNSFLLLNGDSFFDINFLDLLASVGEVSTLALREVGDASRYGSVILLGDTITHFSPRPILPGPGIINGGVGLIQRSVIEALQPEIAVSMEGEVYPNLASVGLLKGRIYRRPFIDIGVPDEFERGHLLMHELTSRAAVVFDATAFGLRTEYGLDLSDLDSKVVGAAVKAVNDRGMLVFLKTLDPTPEGETRATANVAFESAFNEINHALSRVGARLDAFVSISVANSKMRTSGIATNTFTYRTVAGFDCDSTDWKRTIIFCDEPRAGSFRSAGALVEIVTPDTLLERVLNSIAKL